jgi:hypothetical protein
MTVIWELAAPYLLERMSGLLREKPKARDLGGRLSFAKTVMGEDPPSPDESRLSSGHAEAEQRRTGVVPKSPAKT